MGTNLNAQKKYKRIVIKVGTNVLTNSDGRLNLGVIQNLVNQIAELKKLNIEIILVTSGAMGGGRSILTPKETTNQITTRQVLAAVGQVKLIKTYHDLFNEYDLISAQVLATKEDFRDQTHYQNMRNCLEALLREDVLPIINENDVVAITELMFSDNDELAKLVAQTLKVDALIILTNVDGIYKGDPKDQNSQLIELVDVSKDDIRPYLSKSTSEFGRGGMLNKAEVAYQVAQSGIAVHIANGKKEDILLKLIQGEVLGTSFLAVKNTDHKIGIIGAGKMGSAIYKKLIENFSAAQIFISDHNSANLPVINSNNCFTDNNRLINSVDIVILAIKPQSFEDFAYELKADLKNKLIISIMAGVSIDKISRLTGAKKVIRAMPNLALQISESTTGWIASKDVLFEEANFAKTIFATLGVEIQLQDESDINSLTALSGSGPAYYFYLTELLQEIAISVGFDAMVAQKIAKNTFTGAAEVLKLSSQSPTELKQAVCSKGGTTEAALNYLTQQKFAEIFEQAVYAAKNRAADLNSN